jgi:hypothetical protein
MAARQGALYKAKMQTSETLPLRRFRGVLVWFDGTAGRVRQGRIDRALLRAQGLSLEVSCEGRSYRVSLRPSGDGSLQGSWSRGTGTQEVSGSAGCRLRACGPFFDDPGEDYLQLTGTWEEDGSWDWVGKLGLLGKLEEERQETG